MNVSKLLTCAARAAVLLCSSSMAFADVIYVSANGNGQYTEIQPAIDAAQESDVLLVRSGTYSGFTLNNRALWIVADVGAVVKVNGTVIVQNLGASKACLLSGLQVRAVIMGLFGLPAIRIENNAGHVRMQTCTMKASDGGIAGQGYPGGVGAVVVNSARVAVSSSSLTGGNGGGISLFCSPGGRGGDGLTAQGSIVALYDCTLKGGVGGMADYVNPTDRAGDGGDGCRVYDFGVLASGSQFQGGMGGSGATIPGNGGAGLRVDSGQAQLIGDTLAGGLGGWGYYGNHGANGSPQTGAGVFNVITGAARKLTTRALAAENGTLQFDLAGEPGDKFWLFQSGLPGFVYSPARAGVLLVALPALSSVLPHATLPPSGTATVVLSMADVGTGIAVSRKHWQGIVVTAGGQVRLSSPAQVAVLNCSDLLPDCNGDGSCDTCDLMLPGVTDCDSNGVPDGCQGDCNSNGVVDPCDVLNGTSLDQNHNWIPDECEPQMTWYVNASAAPGGNGSIGAPFQALAPAFAAAISGDTIQVANGLYQGSANRDLDFGGRNMLVKSTGGAANCIIDSQTLGRAFYVSGGTTLAARIEGFTIKNGKVYYPARYGAGVYIYSSSATIRQCVFQNNDGQDGGGLAMRLSNASIQACSFLNNTSSTGAGALVSQGLDVRFQDCTFQGNQGPGGQGGGVHLSQSSVRLERCAFLSNTAHSGGAVYTFQGDVSLDQCLLTGNSANQGGGVTTSNSTWHMTNCTIVGNTAGSDAAAVYHLQTAVSWPRVWRNNVVWNNTGPGGTPIRVQAGPLDIDWCDIQGGQAAVTLASGATLNWGPGNRNQDPLFVDPDGADNNPLTVNDNDYRLALGSPCLDAGENASVAPDWFDLDGDGNVTEPVPIDFDGNARFVDIPSAPDTGSGVSPLVDLGAWERP